MRGIWIACVAALSLACKREDKEDKAAQHYSDCLRFEAEKNLKDAVFYCDLAVKKDANSESGKKAAAKLPTLTVALKAEQDQRAREENERAAKKFEEDKTKPAEAPCSRWTTICTLGRHPDGSERTTGAQFFKTKEKCESIGAEMGGIRCDPCRCAPW